jgi:hypothetical protein
LSKPRVVDVRTPEPIVARHLAHEPQVGTHELVSGALVACTVRGDELRFVGDVVGMQVGGCGGVRGG